eukprot:766513-Hanusia_phi.AAC.4
MSSAASDGRLPLTPASEDQESISLGLMRCDNIRPRCISSLEHDVGTHCCKSLLLKPPLPLAAAWTSIPALRVTSSTVLIFLRERRPRVHAEPLVTRQGLEYEVDSILSMRRRGRGTQHLVKWTGYDQAHENSLLAARELLSKPGLLHSKPGLVRQFEAREKFQALPASAFAQSDSSDSDP